MCNVRISTVLSSLNWGSYEQIAESPSHALVIIMKECEGSVRFVHMSLARSPLRQCVEQSCRPSLNRRPKISSRTHFGWTHLVVEGPYRRFQDQFSVLTMLSYIAQQSDSV